MKSRPVKDCMVYVWFVRTLRLRKQEMKVIRYPTEKRAEEGILAQKNTWWHAVAAIQGRQRHLKGIEEGS